MSSMVVSPERLEELLEDGAWLLTDDSDELCPDCAQEHAGDLRASSREGLKDGWGVVAFIEQGAVRCCVCNVEETL